MERFTEKMDKRGGACWPFLGFVNSKGTGYGMFGWEHEEGAPLRTIGAHVASYLLFKGPVPSGMCVMHNCNNRACVNPAHLELGTGKQNMEHCVATRRIASGERQGLAVMTEDRVRELRARHTAGESGLSLAKAFGISQATASQIIRRVTWRHVA